MSSDALEYFYGITPERLNAMKNTPPPKSTDEAWKEHYRLQEEYIEELEAELERTKQERNAIAKNTREPLLLKLDEANDRIKRMEEAGDAMANAYRQICYDAYDDQQVDNWFKAKEAKP